jgi:hypothetical protein
MVRPTKAINPANTDATHIFSNMAMVLRGAGGLQACLATFQ